MLSRVLSYGVSGVESYQVMVEVFVSNGLPSLDIVGLPDIAVKESRDRVRAALMNSGYTMPVGRVTVNLAPADMKKEGPAYDLPIAIAVLIASKQIVPKVPIQNMVILGELSLDGGVQSVRGMLPMIIGAQQSGVKSVMIPYDNAKEVITVESMTVYPAKSLREVIAHLLNEKPIMPHNQKTYQECLEEAIYSVDMADVKGQLGARRALEIACAGGHNMIMIGVPGAGKTMLARCMPSILPPMSYEEALETTRIHSVTGALKGQGMLTIRPFRAPHHSASLPSLIGGGSKASPGEVSLAHNGVLFLDEIAEFSKATLEALRQPLEDGVAAVTRVQARGIYQSRCMLVASMNPCPCGYYGSRFKRCRCTPNEIKRYIDRISGPLLDRIDIQIEVDNVPVDEIRTNGQAESSAEVLKRVSKARSVQKERFKDQNIHVNAQMDSTMVKKYCSMDKQAEDLLCHAMKQNNMSMRGYTRILKVARTIADLRNEELIGLSDVAEAIQYRSLDGKYWRQ